MKIIKWSIFIHFTMNSFQWRCWNDARAERLPRERWWLSDSRSAAGLESHHTVPPGATSMNSSALLHLVISACPTWCCHPDGLSAVCDIWAEAWENTRNNKIVRLFMCLSSPLSHLPSPVLVRLFFILTADVWCKAYLLWLHPAAAEHHQSLLYRCGCGATNCKWLLSRLSSLHLLEEAHTQTCCYYLIILDKELN